MQDSVLQFSRNMALYRAILMLNTENSRNIQLFQIIEFQKFKMQLRHKWHRFE